jgi:hypothetical protein
MLFNILGILWTFDKFPEQKKPVQQVSYGPLIMTIMLIISCYTGFFNVRRGWQSLNTEPRFYLRLIRRTGWLWIYTSRTTDGHPFKPKKFSVPFLYPGVPAGLAPFRGLVPLRRRNLAWTHLQYMVMTSNKTNY